MTLSTSDEDELREKIVALTRTFLGVPWRHQGRTKYGIDCVGLPIVVGKQLGLHDYPDDVNYIRTSLGSDLFRPFEKYCNRISNLKELKPGDIIVLKDELFPQHVGIMSSKVNVIHATVHRRKVVEEPLVGDFKAKLLRGYKFKVFG